jgi:hypothetical protein
MKLLDAEASRARIGVIRGPLSEHSVLVYLNKAVENGVFTVTAVKTSNLTKQWCLSLT